jgi:hypothetical protein
LHQHHLHHLHMTHDHADDIIPALVMLAERLGEVHAGQQDRSAFEGNALKLLMRLCEQVESLEQQNKLTDRHVCTVSKNQVELGNRVTALTREVKAMAINDTAVNAKLDNLATDVAGLVASHGTNTDQAVADAVAKTEATDQVAFDALGAKVDAIDATVKAATPAPVATPPAA